MEKNIGIRWTAGLLALLIAGVVILGGCVIQKTSITNTKTPEVTQSAISTPTDLAVEVTESVELPFSYSDGIDDSGYWKGIKALDYVQLADYKNLSIPADIHEITEEEIQAEITNLLSSYVTEEQVTDRAVVDGDTVNIDYVGSVDGVEFENGSTQNMGTSVTIGVTSYIDDFLEQLIDRLPGENFDIEVTFPDPYPNNPDLSGKDAVFNVTINYITETVAPELTDEFISENLTATYGWTTVEEIREEFSKDLKNSAILSYIQNYIFENSTVSSTPKSLITYQENVLIAYFQEYADMYGMSFAEFLATYVGYDSTESLLLDYVEDNKKQADSGLIMQAIAEEIDISVSTEDVAAYFLEYMETDDYSSYESRYGLPFLKQVVLYQAVTEYIAENAILE